ncbi:FecR family protein [Marinoscillum sp.]|uniref:FecR family protein n=1 Tax=Marinoscillum sp. TaxID=2024838 RepID=UPI003BAA7C9B
MDFKEFEVRDFLQNEFFVDWVIHQHPEADHFWSNWLKRHPEKVSDVEMARELVKSIHYKEEHAMKSDEYSILMERILQHKAPHGVIRTTSDFVLRHSYRVAASLLFLVGFSLIFYLNYPDATSTSEPSLVWKVAATEYGQKKAVQLPDGTRVMLNSGSTIKYPEGFGPNLRLIKFEGEGFFDVAHNPEKPFVIESGAFTTRVLGTSFNLKHFEEEREASVSVLTGKVEVQTESGISSILLPNEMGIYDKESDDLRRQQFDQRKLMAWTHGTLLFENEDLPTIFERLEKWYGVTFEVKEGTRLAGKYSGEYKQKSLELILEGLSYTSNFNYEMNHKTILIYERKKVTHN